MANIPISKIGERGVISDIPGHEMSPAAWSRVQNVRFIDGYAMRSKGEATVEGTPPIVPNYIFPAPTIGSLYWLYTDLARVYAVLSGTHTEVTRLSGNYTGTLDNKWTDAWLNGIMVLNNGVDMPQVWNPMSSATRLIDLPNFSEPGVTTLRAKVIRPFGNFLIALHITKDSAEYPTMVKWSDRTDPGAVPGSWDASDPTTASGEVSRSNTSGFLVDCLPLRAVNMIYKQDAMIRMEEVRGNQIFSFKDISTSTGLMAIGCVAEFQPGQHVLLTQERDVVVHNGQDIRSIADGRVRRYLQDNIDSTNYERSFVVVNYAAREVWICYPKSGATYCNEAAVWSWDEDTWAFRDLSDTVSIRSGLYESSAVNDAWSAQTENWNEIVRTWGQRLFIAGSSQMVGAFVSDNQIRRVDDGMRRGVTAYTSLLEHLDLALVGVDREGRIRVDPMKNKLVTELWPSIEAPSGTTFQIRVGSRRTREQAVEWQGPQTFDPNVDQFLNWTVDGQFISVRFESSSETDWKFYGYSMEIVDNGRYY